VIKCCRTLLPWKTPSAPSPSYLSVTIDYLQLSFASPALLSAVKILCFSSSAG
jgi:hypothetical protein